MRLQAEDSNFLNYTVLELDSRLSIVPIRVNTRSTTLKVEKRAGT